MRPREPDRPFDLSHDTGWRHAALPRPESTYRASDVPADRLHGTDFTDCPYTALAYAASPRGVVLVLDVPADAESLVTEETWLGQEARRLMVWGTFDRWVVAVIAAKDLRAEVRRKGVRLLRPADKSVLLRQAIARRLGEAAEPSSGTA